LVLMHHLFMKYDKLVPILQYEINQRGLNKDR
jgi:hypothetical protein